MKMLLAFFICLSSSFAHASDSPVGFWSNTRIVASYEDGDEEVSLQTKELMEANLEKNEFLVKLTQVYQNGEAHEYESTEDSFVTPEDGAEIVKNCIQSGGVLKVESVSGKSLDICTFKDEDGGEISFAAVPFGLFSVKYDFTIELPGGDQTTIKMSETLTSFGKN